MILRGLALLLGLLLVAGAVWVRLAPVPADLYHRTGPQREVGDWPMRGGFEAVRRVPDPEAQLARLAGIIAASPRTVSLAGSIEEAHLSFVTRSLVWGFPDITNLWVDGDRVHLRGHLVFGGGDFGVNRARVEGWLAQAGL